MINYSPAKLFPRSKINQIFLGVLLISIVAGVTTGLALAKGAKTTATTNSANSPTTAGAKTPQQDAKTFRDFAEGTIKKRPESKDPGEYVEGTHLLVRDDNPTPVALTSSVVDLSEYEGKKVKVYGETQKALKEGWLMDVGRVEEIK